MLGLCGKFTLQSPELGIVVMAKTKAIKVIDFKEEATWWLWLKKEAHGQQLLGLRD